MRKLLVVPLLALLVGCVSFSTHVFRTEQAAVEVAYYGYTGYTNWLLTELAKPNITFDRKARLAAISNEVKSARLSFAATVQTVEAMRVAYETNSAIKPPLEAALLTMTSQSSNVCWLINYWRNQ